MCATTVGCPVDGVPVGKGLITTPTDQAAGFVIDGLPVFGSITIPESANRHIQFDESSVGGRVGIRC